MDKEIKLPKVAEGAESATVTDILVKEGDKIEIGQSLIVVESEKASVEVPSEEAGTVKTISAKKDAEIKPGDVILILETEEQQTEGQAKEKEEEEQPEEKKEGVSEEVEGGETEEKEEEEPKEEKKEQPAEAKGEGKVEGEETEAKEEEEEKSKAQPEEKKEQLPKAKGEEKVESEETEAKEEEKSKAEQDKEEEPAEKKEELPEEAEGRETEAKKEGKTEAQPKTEKQPEGKKEKPVEEIAAAPNALRLARELGININDVKPGGPEGRILEEDVLAHAREMIQGRMKGAETEEPLPDFSKWGSIEKQPLKSIRKATAKKTIASWHIIPHVSHFDEAEISKIEELRKNKNHLAEKQGGKLTVTAILLKIMAEALKEFPKFNASIDMKNEEIILKQYIHIGVAVDTERGLLVPVVRDVDKKNLISLSVELTELSEKARNGRLSADEMNGGSFVISNVGGIGGTSFTQLIYHPQVAILGVAKAEIKPVFKDGEFKPKLMLPLSLTYDHRLIDGADAARFLRWTCDVIENPLNLFIEE